MIVSVDTSVWIAFLKKRPESAPLAGLLGQNVVEVHPFVLAELMLGNLGGRRDGLLADLGMLTGAPALAHDDLLAFVDRHELANSRLGYVDAHLVASAHTERHLLWSFDGSLRRAAERFGLAFDRAAVAHS
ncbi:MAG TPA: PIN domain-containing protein [Polyangia bacterium]|nr:PIN domain-containing protein [Polyangia bacterium]